MLQEKPKRECIYSKIEFVPKRSNQVFMNKACRIAHHNDISNALRRKLSKINNLLIKNYKILTEIMKGKNEGQFHSEFLRGKGFSFSVHTHIEKVKDKYIYAVYEFSFYKINDSNYLITRL
jgi:hypothetical protein